MLNGRSALRSRARSRTPSPQVWVGLAVVAAAALVAASVDLRWWAPIALLLLPFVVAAVAWWVRLLARRDSHALIVLWLIFALNRTLALLVPEALGPVALSMDDAALAAALAVVLLTRRKSRVVRSHNLVFLVGMAVFGVSGVVSAVLDGISTPALLLGTWLGLKLLVAVYVCTQFDWTEQQVRRAFRIACWLMVVVIVVALLQVVAPGQVNAVLGATQRERLGASVITSIFREPAQYSAFAMLAIIILLARAPSSRLRLLSSALVGAAALLSLRLKAVVDLVLIVTVRALTSPARAVRLAAPVVAGVLGGAALLLGANLIAERAGVLFGTDVSPRRILYTVAGRLAADNAPLGGGFASFGSEASITFYSPVYKRYGLSDLYGFRERRPSFLHDASWATVLGETGWLGVAGVAAALLAIGFSFWAVLRSSQAGYRADCARAGLMFTLVVLADSITTPAIFTGFTVVSLGMLYSMAQSEQIDTAASVGSGGAGGPHEADQVAAVPAGSSARKDGDDAAERDHRRRQQGRDDLRLPRPRRA